MPNLHKFTMAAILTTFAHISGSETRTRRDLLLVSIPMSTGSRNIFKSVFSLLDQYFMPYLHKFKMAAILTTFIHISGSDIQRDLILVSIPMFLGSTNSFVSVFITLSHLAN